MPVLDATLVLAIGVVLALGSTEVGLTGTEFTEPLAEVPLTLAPVGEAASAAISVEGTIGTAVEGALTLLLGALFSALVTEILAAAGRSSTGDATAPLAVAEDVCLAVATAEATAVGALARLDDALVALMSELAFACRVCGIVLPE